MRLLAFATQNCYQHYKDSSPSFDYWISIVTAYGDFTVSDLVRFALACELKELGIDRHGDPGITKLSTSKR